MKLLNVANSIVKGSFSDLISLNNSIERSESPIAKALKRKKEQLPQFDFLFVVKMPDLTIGGDNTASNINYQDKQFDIDNDINHRVFSINAPNPNYDTTKTQTKNTYWYSASNKDIGQITITMDEYEDTLSLKYINSWISLIENSDGTYNVPIVYKRDISIVRYSGTKNELMKITYKGCFPTGIAETSYTYEGSGILQYNVTFACDRVVYDEISPSAKKAIAEVQQSIIDNLPNPKSGTNLNTDSAINILGRIADIVL